MTILRILAAAAFASMPYSQAGILTPVGPFAGTMSESWESTAGWQPVPRSILAGTASVNTGAILITYSGTQSAGGGGTFQASEGLRYAYLSGPDQNLVRYTFQETLSDFGAYWGAYTGNSWPDPATIQVRFRNAGGSEVGFTEFSYAGSAHGVLEWHGWSSSVGIKTIEITSPTFLIMDGLQANVPEASHAATFAGMGLLTFGLYKSYGNRNRHRDL